jgi:hypothetical protein
MESSARGEPVFLAHSCGLNRSMGLGCASYRGDHLLQDLLFGFIGTKTSRVQSNQPVGSHQGHDFSRAEQT